MLLICLHTEQELYSLHSAKELCHELPLSKHNLEVGNSPFSLVAINAPGSGSIQQCGSYQCFASTLTIIVGPK